MSTKEKYISEAKMNETPKKRLGLILGDKCINPKHLADTVKEDVIQPMIDSSVAKGNRTINEMQESLNEMRKSLPEGVIISSDDSSFEAGTSLAFTLTARTVSNEDAIWKVYKGDNLVYEEYNVTNITYTETLSLSATYYVYATVENYTYSGSWTVTAISPFYVGAGATYSDVLSSSTNKRGAKSDVSGSYSVTVNTTGHKLFVIVPTGTAVNKIAMSGFNVPVEPMYTVNGNYKVYESSNTYQAGTYTILLNSYASSEADVVEGLHEWQEHEEAEKRASAGDSYDRPVSPRLGQMYFDTDLGYSIWWNGEHWINASGNEEEDVTPPNEETEP